MRNDLNFLSEEPTVSFRVVKRKGELRYIASNRRSSLKAVTQFAPPTKSLPKLVLWLASLCDFGIPGFAMPIRISVEFVEQAAAWLNIPLDRIGIYVGEPNDRRKLVIIDTEGESKWILKMAIGEKAESAVRQEQAALFTLANNQLQITNNSSVSVPVVHEIEPVDGHATVLIERVDGRQFSPKEFEAIFLGFDYVRGSSAKLISVGEWLDTAALQDSQRLELLLVPCRASGALDIMSDIGRVHGDFMSWNLIKTPAEPVLIDWEFSCSEVPIVFDKAYAAYCYSVLLGSRVESVDDLEWSQLVALGALWKELRGALNS